MREHRHDLQEYVDFTELQGFREMCTSSLQWDICNTFPQCKSGHKYKSRGRLGYRSGGASCADDIRRDKVWIWGELYVCVSTFHTQSEWPVVSLVSVCPLILLWWMDFEEPFLTSLDSIVFHCTWLVVYLVHFVLRK
jgi:hypothetical protein